MNAPIRNFTACDAVEARSGQSLPLLIGLTGPSGSGKTFSALRLATGIQAVVGGDIFVIDTEQRRSLHYAEKFKFKHVPFTEPFSSLDYLAALRFCKAQGAGVVVVDSCSHEHDGPGGLHEQHEAELDRMAGTDYKKRDRVSILAWQKPKAKRRKLINAITSELDMPVIFCFRAKTATKPVPGGQPVDMGFTSIGAPEWMFEMAWQGLMLPGSKGLPTWQSDKPGERQAIKMVDQFEWLQGYGQLDEAAGERCALWARGSALVAPDRALKWSQAYLAKIDEMPDLEALLAIEAEHAGRLLELQTKRPDIFQQISFALSTRKAELDPELRSFESEETGRAETDHGDQNDPADERPAWKSSVDDWTARALAAEHMAEINAIQKQYDLSRAVLPDDVVADLDAAISAARKRIGGGG